MAVWSELIHESDSTMPCIERSIISSFIVIKPDNMESDNEQNI